jgi:hypothetical protein
MSFTTAQLQSEINTDPSGQGYAPLVSAGNFAGVAAKLNTVGATNIFRNDVGVREVINAIVAADFAALTALQVAKLQMMFTGTVTLDATSANTRSILAGIFSGMTNTVNALTALAQRPGSRAEVLWGAGTVVSWQDVAHALTGAS